MMPSQTAVLTGTPLTATDVTVVDGEAAEDGFIGPMPPPGFEPSTSLMNRDLEPAGPDEGGAVASGGPRVGAANGSMPAAGDGGSGRRLGAVVGDGEGRAGGSGSEGSDWDEVEGEEEEEDEEEEDENMGASVGAVTLHKCLHPTP